MNYLSLIQLLGGVGMFLYGMNLLGASLERLAGAGLEQTLERLTNSRLKGVLLGTAVTAVIQSSTATGVMIIGFLNAGIMKLVQAVSVVMGANIGTTITAQILRLGDVSSDNILLSLLKPSSFSPICVAVGAALLLLAKRHRTKDKASILIGFGILFMGITLMESTMAPLKESAEFRSIFYMFENPLLGVLLGIVVTVLLQSSSASVGVLQALSSTGTITWAMAMPIVIGQNVGKCASLILASIGSKKRAKRAVCIDVMMNSISAVLFLVVLYAYQHFIGFSFWDAAVTRGNIADFHTLFNLLMCLGMFPFVNVLIRLSERLSRDNQPSRIEQELRMLDDMFLKTPSLALGQCKKAILSMGETVDENFALASELLKKYDDNKMELLQENERFLDRSETVLGDYLVKIGEHNPTPADNRLAAEILHTLGDLERIGDYCVNLAEAAEMNAAQNVSFSYTANRELEYMTRAVSNIINTTMDAYRSQDVNTAFRVEPMEQTIDILVETLKSKHIERLQKGVCTTKSGISFVELLTDMERISDHCSNIAVHLTQRLTPAESFDTHEHLRKMHESVSDEYQALCRYYESIYYEPVKNGTFDNISSLPSASEWKGPAFISGGEGGFAAASPAAGE